MLPLSVVGAPLEMTKHRWRELIQVLYESHFDPRKDEELKLSKIDIENKLPKMLKLVKERRQNRRNRGSEANARKESELIELIEDLHRQYQFVYDLYDNLRQQLSQTVNGNIEDEGYYTATSGSDSDLESEEDENTEKTHLINVYPLSDQTIEIDDLKQKIAKLTREKESMNSDYMEAINKSQETEESMHKLREESRLMQEKLQEREQELSRLAQMHKLRQSKASALMKELESELSFFNLKLKAMCTEKRAVEPQADNETLQEQVSDLEKIAKDMDAEFPDLVNRVDSIEDGSVSEVSGIKSLMVQMENLKQNVDCLNAQKGEPNGSVLHENLSDQVNKMKRDLGAMRKKNSELEWKIKKRARENSDFLSQIDSLKRELASRAQKALKEREDSAVRVKDLEFTVHNVCSQKSAVERHMMEKDQENVQLKQDIEALEEKTAKLEKMLKEQEDQFYSLQKKKLKNGEGNNKSAQMVALMTQINHLEQELGSKNEFERLIKSKNQDIARVTSEREYLKRRMTELEKELEDKSDEFSAAETDMSTQIAALTRQINQLLQEVGAKRKLEDQIHSQEKEFSQLGEEKEILQARILELEITLTEQEDELDSFRRRIQIGENDTSSRISGLTSQISYLQEALSAERKKSLEKLSGLVHQNNELKGKTSNQQAVIKQHEDNINKLRGDCKLVKGRFLQAADRKMDEVAEEFRQTFEAKLRVLSQRIRVAEQLHAEDKETLKKMQQHCQQAHPNTVRKFTSLKPSNKDEIIKISQAVDNMMKNMENVINNFESKEEMFLKRLSRVSDDLNIIKNCFRWTMEPWKNEPSSPFSPLDDREQEKIMKQKVKKLEAKVNKEKGDKLKVMKAMYELQKKVMELERSVAEKDEGLSSLENEKIEAIKQLCIWIEYHQNRFEHLKDTMLVKKNRS